MTGSKGRLSLGSDVNLNKVMKDAQAKKKFVHSASQAVKVEVRRSRVRVDSLVDSDIKKEDKSQRLKELLSALQKENKSSLASPVEEKSKSEEINLDLQVNLEQDSGLIKSTSTLKEDPKKEEDFTDKKSLKVGKKQIKDNKNKKDIMHLLEEEISDNDLLKDENPILSDVKPEKIIIKKKYNTPFNKHNKHKGKIFKKIKIYDGISVANLAHEMGEQFTEVRKKLKDLNIPCTQKDLSLDIDTAELIVGEFGHSAVIEKKELINDILLDRKSQDLVSRAPVVTIMGHVDHGKTTLLGVLHNIDLTSGEAGGITQHIGAYQVNFKGRKVTFIDTPGHEAFAQIRSRGAQLTDIVILVVAANDSVKPQTVEAINHAKVSNVPIILAINKCDLEDSDPDKVRQDLLQHSVIVEEMGGDVMSVEISAKKKKNLDKLIELILLQADIMELKANQSGYATGVVIEVCMKIGQGIVTSLIVQSGTLKVGDAFIVGNQIGKVRSILDDNGKKIKSALPSQPVQIIGIKNPPKVGDKFVAFKSESDAQKILNNIEELNQDTSGNVIRDVDSLLLDEMSQMKKINLIIKADTHGSVEGIIYSLNKISNENSSFNFVFTGVGSINESDVMLAQTANAVVIGFNVDIQARAKEEARRYNVNIYKHKIIYHLVDEMFDLLSGSNENAILSTSTGKCKVLKIFDFKKYKVAGCILEEGEVKISDFICVVRNKEIIHKGNLKSLRIVKENVDKIYEGEFGLICKDFNSLKDDDIIYFVPKI